MNNSSNDAETPESAETTPRQGKIPAYLLNLAGEYRICSELNKRGVFATVTYGHDKGADVYAISDKKGQALKIEVKTSQQGDFVTNLTRKGLFESDQAPDFWVLYQIRPTADGKFAERFFVLSHAEICHVQRDAIESYAKRYRERHGREYDPSTGVDCVRVANLAQFEDQWQKIIDKIGRIGPDE